MFQSYNRPTFAEIYLKRFSHNIDVSKKLSHSDIIAVVKADAYGHGAIRLSRYAYENNNIKNFAVATMTEALSLRDMLPKDTNILILGYITESHIEEAINADLILPVFNNEYALSVSDTAGKLNKKAKVALELDTGMSRLGFETDIILKDFLTKYPNLNIVHILSHLATSDSDNNFASKQTERFDRFLDANSGYEFTTSFLNSSGIASYENRWNFTRPGILLYGYESSGFIKDILPVMKIFSTVTHIKRLKKGESVGYGRTFFAPKDMTIGVVPIGYADGYPRSLSNTAYMIVDGVKCNVVGNICMDMTMIDVTHVGANPVYKSVEIMGDNITAELIASWSNSISYEILTGISYRVPRVYID